MTDVQTTETGLFSIVEDRTVEGLLLPYNEESRLSVSNTAPIKFAKGTIRLPRDPSVVTLNEEHSQFAPLGRAIELRETEEGVVAKFAIANTDEGDAYLAAPEKRRLSPELRDLVRRGADAVTARLTGAAITTEGAFASAALFALGDITEELVDAAVVSDSGDLAIEANELPSTVTVTAGEETKVFTPEDAPTADNPANEETENATMSNAVAPATAAESVVDETVKSANALFSAITTAARSGDKSALEAIKTDALFALADQTYDKNATDPGKNYEQILGEIWTGDEFERQIVPLFTSGTLTELRFKQSQWVQKPLVDKWDGNKTAIPSRSATRTVSDKMAQRFAGGLDIAREYADFGHTDDIAEIVRQMVQSYKENSDAYVLDEVLAAATEVASSTYPTGVSKPHGVLVQGARAVRTEGRARATFAVLADDLYEELLFTPKDGILEYLGGQFGIKDGSFDGFQVVNHPDVPAGHALIGASQSARVLELPGSPIRVSAQDIARGGLDEAVFGYVGVSIQRPSALVLIDTTGTGTPVA